MNHGIQSAARVIAAPLAMLWAYPAAAGDAEIKRQASGLAFDFAATSSGSASSSNGSASAATDRMGRCWLRVQSMDTILSLVSLVLLAALCPPLGRESQRVARPAGSFARASTPSRRLM